MQNENIVISLDAMGGDNAPHSVVHGANLVAKEIPDIKFIFFGNEDKVKPLILKSKFLNKNNYTLVDTKEYVENSDKPAEAIRKKTSSMRLAINSVKEKKAHACVSSGNTGALMVLSKLILKALDGVHRPAIATVIPTVKSGCLCLDLGANVTCDEESLLQFAIMGGAYLTSLDENIKKPVVKLLNIGSEELKGNELIKNTSNLMAQTESINYQGYVEPDQIFDHAADIVVTDGFTGNIFLKSIEGTAKFLTNSFKKTIKQSLLAKIGIIFMIVPGLKLKKTIDPKVHNGAILLGLNGISVKSHGSANASSFYYAILKAYRLAKGDVINKIKTSL